MFLNKKPKILILNNYSVQRVTDEINTGMKPAHHLYGILNLSEADYETIILDPLESKFWKSVEKLFDNIPVIGIKNLSMQIHALKKRKEYDMIYAPCQDVTMLLGFLSYFGIFNKKIVAIAHHPFLRGKLARIKKHILYFQISGHSRWGALSNNIVSEINKIAERTNPVVLHWGPRIKYYDNVVSTLEPQNLSIETDIIAIGRTGRDYQVLIDAFTNTDIKVEIYCSIDIGKNLTNIYSSNITVILLDAPESINYIGLIKLYKRAKIIAIPMFEQKFLCGLTSITDALALGIPIVSTKNEYIDIDIEAEGIGYWINPNDPVDWRNKVNALLSNNDLLKKMGIKSRSLAEKKYNDDIYFKELLTMIESV